MPFKNFENPPDHQHLWREEPCCDEGQTQALATELAGWIRPGAWILLEGPMGAGKSTFAREVLRALQVTSAPEGSPTFAIAHEYSGVRPGPGASRIIHLDLYRLEDPEEFEAAGISSYFWDDPEAILLCEWTSLWPDLENALLEDSRHDRWKVRLEFSEPPLNEGRRIRIDRYPSGTGLLEDGANLLK